MDSVLRKHLLYKSKVEYADYCVNHVEGCSHGCRFPCYAMLLAQRFGKVKTYEDWCKPKIVSNALELLNKEIPKLKKDIKSVHLCFTTDPFMYKQQEVQDLSLDIIEKFNRNGIKCVVLTKGAYPCELRLFSRGFGSARFGKDNEFGITLVSLSEEFRNRFEPNTAPYQERIDQLRMLHNAGLNTWVSIEPYPTPNVFEQDLGKLLESVSFVDRIVFGRWNYNPKTEGYEDFYDDCARQVIKFCEERKIAVHIKEGTMKKGV